MKRFFQVVLRTSDVPKAHWLFQMRVPSLDAVIAVVRANGGIVLGPFATERGKRIAVCDDPQGAAFALRA